VSEHLREPRYSPGSSWDADGKIRIEMGLAYPIDADREFDTRTTEAPADLMAALDEYLGVMATFMRANRDKSRVGLTAGGQAMMRPDEGPRCSSRSPSSPRPRRPTPSGGRSARRFSKRFALDNYKPGVFRVQRECEAVAENKNQAEAMPRDERGPAHENLTRAGRGAYRSRMRRRRSRSRFEARGV